MNKNRAPTDAVYRQMIKSEAGLAEAKYIASLLWDLLQCYEHVGHDRLWRECQVAAYPLSCLRFAMHTYRWPRVLLVTD